MKKIFVTGSAKVILPDQGSCKASKLLSILQLSAFEITFNAKADFLLAIDHNKLAYKKFIDGGGTPERAFLLRLEPPSVFPAQYRHSIESKYGTIFTPGSILVRSKDFIGWPYQIHADPNSPTYSVDGIENFVPPSNIDYEEWCHRELFLAMIAANKVAPTLGQNYALRRKFAKNLKSPDFHLFGALWNESFRLKLRHRLAVSYFAIRQGTRPNIISIYGNLLNRYPRSLGSTQDKHLILKNSKFSLIIENSDTYVSEKLFDSLINGCIPVYFGPELDRAQISKELVISYHGSPNNLIQTLANLSGSEIQSKLNAIAKFLSSDSFKNTWFESNVYENIAKMMMSRMKNI